MDVFNFYLETELKTSTEEIDKKIKKVEASLPTPTKMDILKLIMIWEKLKQHNTVLKSVLKHVPDASKFLEEQDAKVEKLAVTAKTIVSTYISLEQKRLTEEAKKAISSGEVKIFRNVIWELECLNEGTGSVAYANGWISWNQRPWYLHDLIMGLREKFAETHGASYYLDGEEEVTTFRNQDHLDESPEPEW